MTPSDWLPHLHMAADWLPCFCLQDYYNCSCGPAKYQNLTYSNITDGIGVAKSGVCTSDCSLLYIFLPLTFVVMFFTFMMAIPGTTIILR